MKVDCNFIDNLPVLTPRGVLDTSKCDEVRKKIINLAGFGEQYIIIDLEHVSFLDSGAFGVLREADKETKSKNALIVLAGLKEKSDPVKKIVQAFAKEQVFPTLDEAIETLKLNKRLAV